MMTIDDISDDYDQLDISHTYSGYKYGRGVSETNDRRFVSNITRIKKNAHVAQIQ